MGIISLISKKHELTILCGAAEDGSGFKEIRKDTTGTMYCPHKKILNGRILIQQGVLSKILSIRPDAVLACASVRDLTYWATLILCKALKIKVFSHGQGPYSKKTISLSTKITYKLLTKLTHKYICYTEISKDSLLLAGCNPNKLEVANNSIRFKNDAELIKKTGTEEGLLFVGRLRKDCSLEKLIEATSRLRQSFDKIKLHIVGSGELEQYYRDKYNHPWILFYGAIYDDSEILKISESCRFGCYPGDAGLSIVHFFSLKLPPIAHSDITRHMGPEPSYIKDGRNGLTFERTNDPESLFDTLKKAWGIQQGNYIPLSENSFITYKNLNTPPLEEKILKIIEGSPQ